MGNQQSGDTASQSVSTASSEPLPTLLGHTRPTGPDVERAKSKPAEIEVELPDVPDADDAVDCKDIFGPQLFTMSVPFLIVLSVSALLPVPDKWEISFVSLRLGVWTILLVLTFNPKVFWNLARFGFWFCLNGSQGYVPAYWQVLQGPTSSIGLPRQIQGQQLVFCFARGLLAYSRLESISSSQKAWPRWTDRSWESFWFFLDLLLPCRRAGFFISPSNVWSPSRLLRVVNSSRFPTWNVVFCNFALFLSCCVALFIVVPISFGDVDW